MAAFTRICRFRAACFGGGLAVLRIALFALGFVGSKPAGPKTSIVSCGPPRSEASARAALRAAEAQPIRFRPQPAQNEILRPRRPVKDAVRPLRIRGLRADRYHGKLAVRSPPKPGKQLSPLHRQSQASCSAQRGGKTENGFPARRTSTAQSTAQFSAPCPPHCGSATAPPVPLGTRKMGMPTPNRRPLGFHFDFAIAKRAKSPFRRAGDGALREVEFFARLARFIYIRLTAEIVESLLLAGRAI